MSIAWKGTDCDDEAHRPGNEFISMTCTTPPDPFHIKVGLSDLVYFEDPDDANPSDEDCVQLITQAGQLNGTPSSYDPCAIDNVSVTCAFDSPFDDTWTEIGSNLHDPLVLTTGDLRGNLTGSTDEVEKQELRSELVSLYMHLDTLPAALDMLKDMALPGKAEMVAATYMSLDSSNLAAQWLDSINPVTTRDSVRKATLAILIDAAKNGRGLDSLTDSEIDDLQTLVDADTTGYNSVAPQVVLGYVDGSVYKYKAQEWPDADAKRNVWEPKKLTSKENPAHPILGHPVPNPTTGFVEVAFELPEGTKGTIQIIDVFGKVLQHVSAPSGAGTVHLDLTTLPRGIVFCILTTEQWPAQAETIVIQ